MMHQTSHGSPKAPVKTASLQRQSSIPEKPVEAVKPKTRYNKLKFWKRKPKQVVDLMDSMSDSVILLVVDYD